MGLSFHICRVRILTSKRLSTFERRHTEYNIQYAKAEDHRPNDFGFGGKPPRRLKLDIVAHRTRLVPLTPPDYRRRARVEH
jgi:hypothetical protein